MKEGHGNNDKYACGPDSASKPKADGSKGVEASSVICGTTKGLGDDLPDEHDKSKDIASSDPEVSLVSWRQLLEVRETELGL